MATPQTSTAPGSPSGRVVTVTYDIPVPYALALHWQAALVAARIADAIPDTLLVLQHTPVITRGVRARDAHVLASPSRLTELGIESCDTPRGGDVTYHGPGQIVLYPILRLTGEDADAHRHVTRLEETAIRTAADFGIAAVRRPGKTGVWTPSGKLAAIGVRFQRWVSSHGISFNVSPDLAHFGLIVPCGLAGERVASLQSLLGTACPPLKVVRSSLLRHFAGVFERPVDVYGAAAADLPAPLAALLSPASVRPA